MVSYNQFSEIGDIAIVKMDTPLVGVSSLYGYFDDVYGEDEGRYFIREFSYSNDGIVYYDWVELTSYNLQSVEVVNNRIFDLRIRYTRAGTDTSGLLRFNSITVQAKFIEILNPPSYQDSFLPDFFDFNDSGVLGWAINVLQKVYSPGIVPSFIERSNDFIEFWGIVTHWFAIQVYYARQFEDITKSSILFLDYLKNKGLITNPSLTQEGMLSLMENIYVEFRKRGTKKAIFDEDSEFKRLLETYLSDEFIFCFTEKEKISWFLNQSSPVYRGNRGMMNAVKGYSLSEAPITEGVTLNGEELEVELSGGDFRGVISTELGSLLLIDPRIAYEVFVEFKLFENSDITEFYFGVKGFDRVTELAEEVEIVSIETLLSHNSFLETSDGVVLSYHFGGSDDDDSDDDDSDNNGEVFSFRGCLYPESQESFTTNYSKLSVYLGRHLRMPTSIKAIIPDLLFKGSGTVNILSVQIRPINTVFSLGFLGMNSLILFWGLNNSGTYSKVDVGREVDNYLIPAETKFFPVWLDEQLGDSILPLVVSSILKINITCFALDDGQITITVLGGESPYEYSLDGTTFQSENVFTGLAAGSYSITVRDAVGSILTSSSVEILRPSAISIISLQVNMVSVYGASDGSIIVSAGGGTAPLFYMLLKEGGGTWAYQTSNVFIGLGEGDYMVRVKDSNDCPYVESDQFEITQPERVNDLAIVDVNVVAVTTYEGSNGSITVIAIGGVTPLQYAIAVEEFGSWGHYQASNNFSGLIARTYMVRVKDSEDNIATRLNIVVTQPSPPAPTITFLLSLSVIGADYGLINVIPSSSDGRYEEGTEITITAYDNPGVEGSPPAYFKRWQIWGGSAWDTYTIEHSFSYLMPSRDVQFRAIYEDHA